MSGYFLPAQIALISVAFAVDRGRMFDILSSLGGTMLQLSRMYFFVRSLIDREEGQDLVEYALVVALIAFGAITGMGYLATGLNNAFSTVASTLTANT
jgi:pilus assembly protein Flp/PilA